VELRPVILLDANRFETVRDSTGFRTPAQDAAVSKRRGEPSNYP
jgi:hypothetical protein